ncbi:hypothetical protein A2188_03455 [Candidatus Woesebacteria bacterium RIFOXYA1_FULL_43_9]|uniref:Addiction module toxin RelE n=1 Tax=Candidatus Woesebacteria bacterium RIFOXYA1_FULL_43_9 TaxID=1802534 RepID=A0A1F8CNY2_9BACT|nr:MAG: hypothetical protein A2188_03455 [Candidatus Woesebacteria bacterium RIFOXYA1_FULL_43_9]
MYRVQFTESASKDLKKLDRRYLKAVNKALDKLADFPTVGKPLKGELQGFWKLRFSRYRIIYQIIERKLLIIVFEVRHRKDVYR